MDVDVTLVSEIDRRKDNFLIFSTAKTLNERFSSKCVTKCGPSEIPAVKENLGSDKRRTEMETLKELEESLRLFSKRRRLSPKNSRNEKSTISHSAKKKKPFSAENSETTKKHIKQELSSDINELSFDDFELRKPLRKPEINSSEVTSIEKKQISRHLESMKPYNAEINYMDETLTEKVKRITKPPGKRRVISSEVSSNETIKKISKTDLESVKPYRKREINAISGRKVKISSIGGSNSTKPICDENMNRFLSDGFDLINPFLTETNYFEVSSSSREVSRISSNDSKSVEKFTNHEKWRRFQSSENESISNSDYNFQESTFKRPWSYRNNYVSSATETEYFRNKSYASYGFRRNSCNSPYHYRKNFQEVRSYSWNSLDQRNRYRLTKEQLDDEIDQYMSEVKLKPTSAKEDDLDSFVEEYFMETEKVLRENDYEFE